MGHEILYDHLGDDRDTFRVFRLVWEPYTNRVALHFCSRREAAHGLIGTPDEIVRYLDERAASGPPWDRGVPLEARERLVNMQPKQSPDMSISGSP